MCSRTRSPGRPSGLAGFLRLPSHCLVVPQVVDCGWPHRLLYPEMAAAGLRTTPSDLARVILEVQRALRGHAAILSGDEARAMVGQAPGLGFFVTGEGAARRFGHDGWNYGFTCALTGYVERGEGAVIMTNADSGLLMYEVLATLAEAYHWPRPGHAPRSAVAINEAVAERYTGRYAWEPGMEARVLREGSRLFLEATHMKRREMAPFPPAELFAESDTTFFTIAPPMRVWFEQDAAGHPVTMVHGARGEPEKRSQRLP